MFLSAADYLSEIEAETSKLDSGLQMQPVERGAADAVAVPKSADAGDDAVRQEFEKKLKDKYRGSYIFYTKLPLRSREEMVQEYVRGTSFVKIRSKIVNRYMNR